MSKLGIVDEDSPADPGLLVKVTRWCALPVTTLKADLTAAGICVYLNELPVFTSMEQLYAAIKPPNTAAQKMFQ